MMAALLRRVFLGGALLLLAACRTAFDFSQFPSNDALYVEARRLLDAGKESRAASIFEELTRRLAARDTLLPRAHYYTGVAHARLDNFQLSAEAFGRVANQFPNDSLADDALMQSALSYWRLWRSPELDPTYGFSARAALDSLLSRYPGTSLREEAFAYLHELDEWFAEKEYQTGYYYFRRGAYDGAIKYFEVVVESYPTTTWARRSRLNLVRSYKRIQYQEEAAEQCVLLRQMYPGDGDVADVCGGAAAVDTLSR